MASANIPTLRWGIIATGLISSAFVKDLILTREDAKAKHIIQAIGSSSLQKGKDFVQKHIPDTKPTVYGSYEEVYSDPEVEAVYIGTPHAFHKRNCLDAIAGGKHVLCEKAFTLNAQDAKEIFAAAKSKGVFVMEAMWTRFTPLMRKLQKMLHDEEVIGNVFRTFCDFGLDLDVLSLPSTSRYKDPALGAGSLLDIGIYSLTWGLVSLDPGTGETAEMPHIVATQTLSDNVDITSSMILHFPKTGRQGIITSTTNIKTPDTFCRIEGTKGHVVVSGDAASSPSSFTVRPNTGGRFNFKTGALESVDGDAVKEFTYTSDRQGGSGLFWEADAVAVSISKGDLESAVMPWRETVRVMEILDEVRRQGGARFPQDDEK